MIFIDSKNYNIYIYIYHFLRDQNMSKNILKKTLTILASGLAATSVGVVVSSCSNEDTTPRLESVSIENPNQTISLNNTSATFSANVVAKNLSDSGLEKITYN